MVVKVVGSNISHKLRLSSVKPSDEGTYECRVIDFSESQTQRHRVQAYLQVQPEIQRPVQDNDEKMTSGSEDHQKIHQTKEEEQRTRQEDHKEDHHLQAHEGNKTEKHQSETQ